MNQPLIFIASSPEDEAEQAQLVAHLNVLRQAGLLDYWSRNQTEAGADWRAALDRAMNQARLAIVLITAHFLGSELMMAHVTPRLLARHKENSLILFPVIAKACAWQAVEWLAELQPFPGDGRPIWGGPAATVDASLSELVKAVARSLGLPAELVAAPAAPAPGRPPFKGLRYFDVNDSALFFGRERLTTGLVEHLRQHNFLAVVGASGSGKSSLVRAGLVPALKQPPGVSLPGSDQPPNLLTFQPSNFPTSQPSNLPTFQPPNLPTSQPSNLPTFQPPNLLTSQPPNPNSLPGSADWPVHIITPTARPLKELAASLTREAESVTATATLMDDLARDARSLDLYIRKLLAQKIEPAGLGLSGPGQGNLSGLPARRLLLLVDQFEELFTLCRDESERRLFIDNLVTAVAEPEGPAVVVIALRADFYAHCSPYQGLRDLLAKDQIYIGPMSRHELRAAIEAPARQTGWSFEPGLVELLLRDAGDEPGALPLLSHALLATWQRRRGRELTLAGYAESGGVHGAIAATAEAVFQQLTPGQQSLARRLFGRLTELGEGTQDTRRRAGRAELLSRPEARAEVEGLLKRLADERLLTTAEETVEVAHEALIHEWPRLRQWLDEDRESLRLQRRLAEAAQEWRRQGRDPSYLYQGARLAQAAEWAGQGESLNELERDFLAASLAEQNRLEQAQEQQRQRELAAAQQLAEEAEARRQAETRRAEEKVRASRRLAWLAVGLTVVALLALAAAWWASDRQREAEEQSRIAQEQSHLALSRQLAAQSAIELERPNTDLALLLAIEAGRQAETVQAWAALRQALARPGRTLVILAGHSGGVAQAIWNGDNSRVLTAGDDGTAKIWDAHSGEELLSLAGHADLVNQATWNGDESRILTASNDGTAKVWDAHSGEELLSLAGHSGRISQAVWNGDNSRILTTSDDGTARVWDAQSGEELLNLAGHSGPVNQAIWNGDESHILTAGDDGTAKIWDAHSGEELLSLAGHTDRVTQAIWNGDESRILTASADGTARVWDAQTGEELLSLTGHANWVTQAIWNGAESRILTASDDGTARVWDAQTGEELLSLAYTGGWITQAIWNGDESRILTASADGTARVWDAQSGQELLTLAGHTSWVNQAAWNGAESRILTASSDGTARVWDTQSGQELPALIGQANSVTQARWNGAESRILAGNDDGTIKVWDATSGEELLTLAGSGWIYQAIWNQAESRILTASGDGTVKVWDAQTGQELLNLAGHASWVTQAIWNGAESRILTASGDNTVKVWDATSGEELLTLAGHTGHVTQAIWNRDESRILTADVAGMVKLWDAHSGEELLSLAGHTGSVTQAIWDGDERRILTSSSDETIKLWDPISGEELLSLAGHIGWANQAVWNRAGSRILAGGSDGTARVWDAQTGAELLTLTDPSGVTQATWNRDESLILTGSTAGTTKIWDTTAGQEIFTVPGVGGQWSADETMLMTIDGNTVRRYYTRMADLLRAACEQAPRNLTRAEWGRFFKGEPYRATCEGLPVEERE
jgi:WD40 repeat protein